jgi:hypothetical protein
MFENFNEIITVISSILTLSVTIIVLLSKLINNKKLRAVAEKLIYFKGQVEKYVVIAEKIENYKGPDKKAWVMNKISEEAINLGIEFDQGLVSDLIEQLVGLTRVVNSKNK